MLAVDQLLNAPICILGFYYAFSLSAVLFGAEPFPRGAFPGWAGVWRATNAEVRAKFWETLVKNWQVWLPQRLVALAALLLAPAFSSTRCSLLLYSVPKTLTLTLTLTKGLWSPNPNLNLAGVGAAATPQLRAGAAEAPPRVRQRGGPRVERCDQRHGQQIVGVP